jgi:signal recognition particle subunit SRP54
LVACDVYRPAAIDQLKVLGGQIKVPVYTEEGSTNPSSIAENAINFAKANGHDVVIVDTAGRLAIDEQMMNEIKSVHYFIKPHETFRC